MATGVSGCSWTPLLPRSKQTSWAQYSPGDLGGPGGTERADRGQSDEGTKEFFKTLASLVYVLQGFWCGVCGVASGPMTRSPARCGSHAGSTYGTGVPPHPSLGIASRVAHRRGDWATWG